MTVPVPRPYGSSVFDASPGGRLAAVDPDSPASRAGLAAGDRVTSAAGRVLRDIIDWQWESDGPVVEIEVLSAGEYGTVRLVRRPGESWGLDFDHLVFDGVRTCRNACAFCFVAQLPPGLRAPLYVRDDDYRLSFLQGNFVTLTNLEDADVDRICEQHLSPLYVSLHAVTPSVRASLICARDDRALERFDELLDGGIEVHVQIVLVPGVNDGVELDTTLNWLAEREGVLSVGVVPLGFTRHQERFARSYEDAASSAGVIDRLEPWRKAFRARDGVNRVHAADEFYVIAGRPIPDAEEYDGFPQYENGIGLVRAFLDEFALDPTGLQPVSTVQGPPVTVVTGELFAPVLRQAIAEAGAADHIRVLAVKNAFFGGNVTVAGLLTAADVVPVIRSDEPRGRYLLPSAMFNDEWLTLDGVSAEALAQDCAASVEVVTADATSLLSAIV